VHERAKAEPTRHLDGFVGAGVVRHDDFVDEVEGNFGVGLFEGLRRVVRGHDHHDLLAVEH